MAEDNDGCSVCGSLHIYEQITVDGLVEIHCPDCGFVDLLTFGGRRIDTVEMP